MKEQPSFIAPLEITFSLRGADVTVTAATVQALGRLLALLAPALDDLAALPADLMGRLSAGEPTGADLVELLELLSRHVDLPAQAVVAATGLPQTLVDALRPDEFAYLFSVAVQVNADFFGRARPVLGAALNRLQALRPAAPPAAATSSSSGPSSATS